MTLLRRWRYIKHITGRVKSSVIPDLIIDKNGSVMTITTDSGKARALNSLFVQQTHLSNPPTAFPDLPPASQEFPQSFYTTPSTVYDALSHLKPGKAPGLDGLPPQIYVFVPQE